MHVLTSEDDEDTIQRFRRDDKAYFAHRLELERRISQGLSISWSGTDAANQFAEAVKQHLRAKINDPSLLKALLSPSFNPGCRSLSPCDGYLAALNKPHVQLLTWPITRTEGNALITADGQRHVYDVIVCATGFDAFTPRFSIIGREGRNLSELWSDEGGYESYMSATVAGFPNFFVFYPPICPLIGSSYPGIERASDYMIRVISRLQTDQLSSICVRDSAQAAFNRWVQSRMPSMVWSQHCTSWYKSRGGKVVGPWPGTILHYYAATEIVRWEDYELGFIDEDQKYSSFGNGVTLGGFDPESFPWLRV
ncbi:hypothetical protein CDD80_4377 [Ophiocordyceps camponoti-rufipedis]|uniref:Monooxygenase n=1 Tax=Ophiocordyceps camponoti-rufipedis TaxID=2004952 RepID=A0A2C5YZ99_9HYPO|nr:hypothetical protein CDD80_4377 [Ophiocordyceps camponoti-rufipedis]